MFFKSMPILVKSLERKFNHIEILSIGIHDFNYLKGIKNLRTHPHYTLHFILQGQGHLFLNDTSYVLSENTFFMTPPNTLMKYYPEDTNPWTYVWFDLKNEASSKDFFDMLNLTLEKPYFKTYLKHKIIPLLDQMFSNDNLIELPIAIYAPLYQIANLLYNELHDKDLLSYIEQATLYIERNYQNPKLKITDIVNELSISQTYLNELFKKETGYTMKLFE